MRFLHYGKDGGKESTVWGYWLIEIKSLFSIVLLKFENNSREAYHTHAFNCFSWVIDGRLKESFKDGRIVYHIPSLLPFITKRSHFHKVDSVGHTWVLSFRGPWAKTWKEYTKEHGVRTLTHGRKVCG